MDCHLMVTADRSRIYEEREKKGESLIIVIEKLFKKYTLDLGIYIHVSGTHNTIRKDYTLSNIPPQAGAYMLYAPSLLQIYLILEPLRNLVKIFAS